MSLPKKWKDKPGCRWWPGFFIFIEDRFLMLSLNHKGYITNPMFGITRKRKYGNSSTGWDIRLNCGKRTDPSKKFKAFVADSRAGGDKKKSLEIAQEIRDEKLKEFLDRGIIQNMCSPQESSIIKGFEVSSFYLLERNRAQEGQNRYAWVVMYEDIASRRHRGKSFSVLRYGDPFAAFVAALKFKLKKDLENFGETRIKEFKVLEYFIRIIKQFESRHGKTGFLDGIHKDLLDGV